MSDPFLGEVTTFGFDWAPYGFALCNGAILTVQQNAALFSLLGNAFGGDGSTTFALPDLRGRTPLCMGSRTTSTKTYQYAQGNTGGSEAVTLVVTTVPPHQHALQAASNDGGARTPAGNLLANVVPATSTSTTNFSSYLGAGWTADTALNNASVLPTGNDAPHSNMQPFSVVNFCIATMGIYPSRP